MILLTAILLPMAASPVAYLRSRYGAYISAAALLPLLAVSIPPAFGLLGWEESYGGLAFRVLPFNGVFLFTTALVGLLVALFSGPYMEHRAREVGRDPALFYLTYGPFVGGLAGAFAAVDLVAVYVFIEVALIASLFQVLYYGYGDRARIAVMYLVWSHVGALLMLAGFLLFYLNGHTQVPLLAGQRGPLRLEGGDLAALLVILGGLVKMATLGVHMWLPYVHAEAPTPLSALLSPVLVGLGGYVIAAVGLYAAPQGWIPALTYYSIATAVYGGLMAYVQRDTKRLFAYSTISQMGYMLLAVSLYSRWGYTAAALIYLSHGLGKAVLFMTAGYLIMHIHTRDIGRMGGLYGYRPELAGAAVVGFLNLAGILTVGMVSEIYLTVAYVQQFKTAYAAYVPYALVLLVTAIYSFNAVRQMFFGPPTRRDAGPADLALASIVAAALASVLLFLPPFSTALANNVYRHVAAVGPWS